MPHKGRQQWIRTGSSRADGLFRIDILYPCYDRATAEGYERTKDLLCKDAEFRQDIIALRSYFTVKKKLTNAWNECWSDPQLQRLCEKWRLPEAEQWIAWLALHWNPATQRKPPAYNLPDLDSLPAEDREVSRQGRLLAAGWCYALAPWTLQIERREKDVQRWYRQVGRAKPEEKVPPPPARRITFTMNECSIQQAHEVLKGLVKTYMGNDHDPGAPSLTSPEHEILFAYFKTNSRKKKGIIAGATRLMKQHGHEISRHTVAKVYRQFQDKQGHPRRPYVQVRRPRA